MLSDPRTASETESVPIQWTPPAPRAGLAGQWDTFIGPGATRAENLVILGISTVAAVALAVYNWVAFPAWSIWQQLVVFLVAIDLFGGIVANAAAPGKRWYHRAGYGFRQRMTFVAVHFFHPIMLLLFFDLSAGLWFGVIYGYLLIASALILYVPVYLQRPLAAGLFAVGVLIGAFYPFPVAGFAWFVPIFYAKLMLSYLVREDPYRPSLNE